MPELVFCNGKEQLIPSAFPPFSFRIYSTCKVAYLNLLVQVAFVLRETESPLVIICVNAKLCPDGTVIAHGKRSGFIIVTEIGFVEPVNAAVPGVFGHV